MCFYVHQDDKSKKNNGTYNIIDIIYQCEYVTLKSQLSLCDNFVAYTKHVGQQTNSSQSVWDHCSSPFRNPQSVGPGIDTRMLSVNKQTPPFYW